MTLSDALGLKLLTIAASLPMSGPDYDNFLHALADYVQAVRLETLGQLRVWAQARKKEMESKRPEGQHPSWDPSHWQQVLSMIDLLAQGENPMTELFCFGTALGLIKSGCKVARDGWNGKGMWIELQPTITIPGQDGTLHTILPFIMMRTVKGEWVPWLASQTDILATDWVLVP